MSSIISCNSNIEPCNCVEAYVNEDLDFADKCEKHFETLNEAQQEKWLEMVYKCDPTNKSIDFNEEPEEIIFDEDILAEEFNESGKNKARSGDLEGALDDFNRAIRLNDKSEVFYSNRGNVLRLLNKFNLAKDDLNRAISLNPSYSSAYLNRGLTFIESGHPTEGCNDIKKALNLGDSNAKVLLDKYCSNDVSVFKEVLIGEQVWMAQNLNVDKFRNGDPIPEAKTKEEWVKAGENKQPAWCYYKYEAAYGEKYGKLYNWYAVNDPRGLAPKGWRIPSDDDWGRLIDYLGSEKPHNSTGRSLIAGSKMKSADGWLSNNKGESGNGTNESGFSGLPGGSCGGGIFSAKIGTNGYWWSSTEVDDTDAKYISLDNVMDLVGWFSTRKAKGFSVRCLKD